MTAYPWPALDNARGRALRLRAFRHLAPVGLAGLAAGTALVAPASSLETYAALTAVLGLAYAAVDAPAAARSGRAAHQREVLPLLWRADGVEVHAHPHAEPPWVLLARSGLLPDAGPVVRPLGARRGAVLVGMVDGCPLEASEVILTREKIVRKVRKVQVPYARAAAIVIDLGPRAAFAPSWAVGLRALRRSPDTGRARRVRGPGMAWGGKAWSAPVGAPAWTGAAWEALADLLRQHPRASVALPDGRHLVVILAKGDRLFHPVSLWLPVARDARAAQAVALMRASARLARALGAGAGEDRPSFGGAPLGGAPTGGAPGIATGRLSPFEATTTHHHRDALPSDVVEASASTPANQALDVGPSPLEKQAEGLGPLAALRAKTAGQSAALERLWANGPTLFQKASSSWAHALRVARGKMGWVEDAYGAPKVHVLGASGPVAGPVQEGAVPSPGVAVPGGADASGQGGWESPSVARPLPPVVAVPVIQQAPTAGNPLAGLPIAGTPSLAPLVAEPVAPMAPLPTTPVPVLGPAGAPLGAQQAARGLPSPSVGNRGGADGLGRREPPVRGPKAGQGEPRAAMGPSTGPRKAPASSPFAVVPPSSDNG